MDYLPTNLKLGKTSSGEYMLTFEVTLAEGENLGPDGNTPGVPTRTFRYLAAKLPGIPGGGTVQISTAPFTRSVGETDVVVIIEKEDKNGKAYQVGMNEVAYDED